MNLLPGSRLRLRFEGEVVNVTVRDWTDERTVLMVTDEGVALHLTAGKGVMRPGAEALAVSPVKPLDS